VSLPGFAAEASIYASAGHYRSVEVSLDTTHGVLPAYLDISCYLRCTRECSEDCFKFAGETRRLCLQECGDCTEACTRPGPRPMPVPPPPQTVCELTAEPPALVQEGGLRIIAGRGGRHCEGPLPGDARLRVRLRDDRSWWPDRGLDENEGVATGFDFDLPVSYPCARGETVNAFVETINDTTGESRQSQRTPIWCI
jgi:hypothetical protein